MNISKTQDLKPFRMNTYKKRGEGDRVAQALLPVLFFAAPIADKWHRLQSVLF